MHGCINGRWPVKNDRKENPVKIIRWDDGSLECFGGSQKDAREKDRKKSGSHYMRQKNGDASKKASP